MAVEIEIVVNNGAGSLETQRVLTIDGVEIKKIEGNNGLIAEPGDILKSGWLDDDTGNTLLPENSYGQFGEYVSGQVNKISSWNNYQSVFDKN